MYATLDHQPIKLTVSSFLMLRGFGAFDEYWKAELLDGELWGVPADGDEEPESDATFPIKLTIEQYELLAKAGAFNDYAKTELIDGQVYPLSPQHRPHGFAKDRIAYRLQRALEELGSTLLVATEQSMAIAPHSEPQPDIVLTSEAFGVGAIPVSSVVLVVEIADTSISYDRNQKRTLFALAEIPEYWIVNIQRRTILQLWQLDRGSYTESREWHLGDQIASATISDLTISTSGL